LFLSLFLLGSGLLARGDPELRYWMERAQEAMRQGNLDEAQRLVEGILTQDPGNPEARALEARLQPGNAVDVGLESASPVRALQIEPEEALRMMREDPYREDAPELNRILGNHYFALGQEKERAGKRGAAMVALRRAAFFQPDEPMIHYELFQAFLRRARLQEALQEAESFLALQPTGALAREMERQLVDVHTRLGEAKMKANRWGVAIEHLRKVLPRVPPEERGFGEVEGNLAICYYTLAVREAAGHRRLKSCEAFSELLALRPREGQGKELFDRQYLAKLRRSALSPLWNQAKASQEEGRLLEAYRFYGHVLELGTQGWMLKLSRQHRKKIEEMVGPAAAEEERRRRIGLRPGEQAPGEQAPDLAAAPGSIETSGAGIPVLPVRPPTLEEQLYGAPQPVEMPGAGFVDGAAVAYPLVSAPTPTPSPTPKPVVPALPQTPWVPGSGAPPPWLRPATPPASTRPPVTPLATSQAGSSVGYRNQP
jgi:tetratricopeptide (TPR) repeat protein